MHFRLLIPLLAAAAAGCSSPAERLQSELDRIAREADARVGIAVISDSGDTVAVNGRDSFPMFSVYKFPQSLAVADFCGRHDTSFADSIDIAADEIKQNTYSPLRDTYGAATPLRLPVAELLAYSLQQSDNNACDILFRLAGGPAATDSLMQRMGFGRIRVRNTEDEMHTRPALCRDNSSTPLEMARLMRCFKDSLRHSSPQHRQIATLMESCSTGTARLAAALPRQGVTFGHKTGTGDIAPDGRLMAVNDAGYVQLPDGRGYSIAVFVSDAHMSPDEAEALIASVSAAVFGVFGH